MSEQADQQTEQPQALAAVRPAAQPETQQAPQRRVRRRATLAAPEGSDPAPYDPPTELRSQSENDARLRSDRPPHWG